MKRRVIILVLAAASAAAASAVVTAVLVGDGGDNRPDAATLERMRDEGKKRVDESRRSAATEYEVKVKEMRPELVEACWNPNSAGAGPSSVTTDVNLTILTDGSVGAIGVSERRDALRPGVAECVQSLLSAIRVTPPDQAVVVTLPVTLP